MSIFESQPYQQRIGFLTGIVHLTSPVSPTRFADLNRKFLKSIKQKQEQWIGAVKGPQKIIKKESQFKDIVEWAIDLKLIHKDNTWMWKSHVIAALTTNSLRDVFLREKTLPNPLDLDEAQRIAYLYVFLDSDGLFLIPFLQRMADVKELIVFPQDEHLHLDDPNLNDARVIYRLAWLDVAAALMKSQSYDKRMEGRRIKKLMEKPPTKPIPRKQKKLSGSEALGLRTYYIKTLSKIEPLVDLRLARRVVDYKPHYSPVGCLEVFKEVPSLDSLVYRGALSKYLNEEFSRKVARLYGKRETIQGDDRERLLEKRLAESYLKLTAKGWPITKRNQLALVTVISSIAGDPCIVPEVDEVLNLQLQLQGKYGMKEIELYTDYRGELSSIKIADSAVRAMTA